MAITEEYYQYFADVVSMDDIAIVEDYYQYFNAVSMDIQNFRILKPSEEMMVWVIIIGAMILYAVKEILKNKLMALEEHQPKKEEN